MQAISKTAPSANVTKQTINLITQTGVAKVKRQFKLKPNKDYDLARLLAAYCDCI